MITSRNFETPFGINVFGSSIIRTEPDFVTIKCAVNCIELQPRDAFSKVKENISKLRTYLSKIVEKEVSSSRTSLMQEYQFVAGNRKFIGYKAKTDFRLIIHNLDQVEEVLSGIVEAGVNEIYSTDFQTSKMKEKRAEARELAFRAAKDKAEVYCRVADITLGKVIHIEDLNPDQQIQQSSHSLSMDETIEAVESIFEPGQIIIKAAVMVSFSIES